MTDIFGTPGNDLLVGSPDDDRIDGGDGNDSIYAEGGNDELRGGNGNDFLNGGLGDDLIDGGDGFDRVSHYTGATAGVTVDLNLQGVAQDTGQGMDTLFNIEAVSGTQFGDTLTGDGGDNWLWGSASTLSDGTIAPNNNDILDGRGGNDLLVVGIGNHTVIGGSGTDTLSFSENGAPEPGIVISLALQGAAQDTSAGNWTISQIENLSGGTNDDQLIGDTNANILAGNLGSDVLAGGAGNDQLYGDGLFVADTRPTGGSGPITLVTDATQWYVGAVNGNDVLEGGLGDDQLYGGGGNDTASYANAGGSVTVGLYDGGFGEAFGADGYDQLHDIENLIGSAFNDILFGNNQDNILSGGAGNDQLRGNAGNDTLLGGGGDDFLGNGAGDDVIDGGAGFDRVSHYTGATNGVTVDLRIQGVAQDTGQGMDTLVGIENVSGTLFADTLIGDDASNWLWGSPATLADGSFATTNNDTIFGGGGNDGIWVGIGNHVIDGGTGIDTLRFTENANNDPAVAISLALQGVAQVTGQGSWTISNIENLDGGTNHDFLTGDANANILAGRSGNDVLIGGSGNDSLYGDGATGIDANGDTYIVDIVTLGGISGNDTLEGGLGNDIIDGGGGIDTASYANAGGGVTVNLGSGTSAGADGNDTLINIENITGSQFNDNLTGSGGGNVIDGLGGNDTVSGGAGDDTLYGGDGDDLVQGDFNENNITVTGNDVLYGGNGNDLLRGGLGNDTLIGGANNDNLRGNAGVDFFDGGDDDGVGVNGIGDRVSFFEQRATQGVVADLRTGIISNDGFGNVEMMVGIESLGSGTAFADTFYGNDGANFLGGDRGDALYAFGGDDIFQLTSAPSVVDGGDGWDRINIFSNGNWLIPDTNGDGLAEFAGAATAGWTVNLAAGTIADGYGNSGTIAGIEEINGSHLGDTLIGNANENILNGAGGNDVIEGRAGNDTIDGNDGTDTASYASASGGVNVNLGTGFASGADGNDTLANIENVIGSQFGDNLTGSGGGNVIDGLGGNDTISGGAGDDTIRGGDGDDFLQGDFNENDITASGNDIIEGGNGNDGLRGGLGDDQLFGGAGNDLLRGNAGVDFYDGGADDGEGFNGIGDRVSFYDQRATQGAVADLRNGIISNDGHGNIETMVGIESLGGGTAYADIFYGNDERNFIGGDRGDSVYGFGGDDIFQLTSAPAVVDGGAGRDRMNLFANGAWLIPDTNGDGLAEFAAAATSGWTVNLAAGTTLDGHGNVGTVAGIEDINGSHLGDTLIGDSNENVLNGLDGDDTLEGRGGNDTLDGGDGIDTASYANASGSVFVTLTATGGSASGADGNDNLLSIENVTGSAFNDSLVGNGSDNRLDGGGGHDRLIGGGGNDTLLGGNGDDYSTGGFGDDVIAGGAGFDRAGWYQTDPTLGGVTVSLQLQGVAQNTGSQGWDTLTGIEHLSGTPFADTLTGDDGDNWLWGSGATIAPGNVSATNNDIINGAGGNDLVVVGLGNHVIDGGSGIDTLSFSENLGNDPAIRISLALAGAAQATTQGNWTINNFENLSGGTGNDELTGDGNANLLAGYAGNDILVGGAGDDTLLGDGIVRASTSGGGSGPIETVIDASVTLGITPGNDLLEGGLGNDTLNGGGGIDTAVYANASGGVTVNLGSGIASGADGNDTLANIENVIGSQFNDNLTGSGGGNVLDGRGGNDTISGGAGDDTLYGGDGDDFLQGDLQELNITVTGNDIIHGENGNDNLRGGLGNDQLYGGANNDLLRGNGGVDYFDGGADDGVGFNGIGDRVSFSERRATQGAIADLRTGIISNDGFGNVETMVGIESLGADTAFIDTFYGDDNANFLGASRGDYLYGFGGDDRFQMGSAVAVLDGGLGIDTLGLDTSGGWLTPDSNGDGLAESAAAATTGWTVNLAAGTLVDGYGNVGSVTGIENVNGSPLGDTLIGDSSVNVFSGFDGNDTLEGRGGNDTLDGGNGIDTASYANAAGAVQVTLTASGGSSSGADGSDTLTSIENVTGSAFNDTLSGNDGANLLSGGDGHDMLYGKLGNDSLLGGAGDDFLRGEDGDDILNGGTGKDRVSYSFLAAVAAGVTVNLNSQGVAQDTGHGMDTLTDIEHVSGTIYDDVLTGNGEDNWLWGGSNGSGVTGNDTILGGGGNDLIDVGAGAHTLDGGTGNDTLSLRGNSTDITAAGITFTLERQGTTQDTEQGIMRTSGFENVSGSIYDDSITGDLNANILLGDGGNDTLRGGDGDDTLYGDGRMGVDTHGTGGSGAIALIRDVAVSFGLAAGNDTLLGGRGNDTIYGGRGNDIMTGNQGADRYVIETLSGTDRITDYADGIDKIVFDSVVGVDDFSDLVIGKSGSDTLITWGTGDSLRLDSIKSSLLDSSDFIFTGSAMSVSQSLAQGSTFGTGSDGAMANASLEAMMNSYVA